MMEILRIQAVCVVLLIVMFNGFARDLTVDVRVDSVPAIGAVVSLYQVPDSTLVNAGVSDSDGRIIFPLEENQTYLVRSQYPGYRDENLKVTTETEIMVNHHDRETELAEFVVTSRKGDLAREPGKFVFDPTVLKDVSVDGFALLKLTPLVTFSDNQFNIFGKQNTVIYINGRDPRMSKEDIIEKLRSIRPEYIKKIEIITEPGLAMNVSGNSGIVNVIVDDPTQGFRGTSNVALMYFSKYLRPSVSFSGNFTKGNFKSFVSAGYQHGGSDSESESMYDYRNNGMSVNEHTRGKNWWNILNARYDAELRIKKTTAGFYAAVKADASHGYSVTDRTVSTYGVDSNIETSETDVSRTDRRRPFRFKDLRYGLFSTTDIGENGSRLSINADARHDWSHTRYDYNYPDMTWFSEPRENTMAVSAKIAYLHVFNPKASLNTGVEYYYSNSKYHDFDSNVNESFGVRDQTYTIFSSYVHNWSRYVQSQFQLNFNEYLRYADGADRYTKFYVQPVVSLSFFIPKGNQGISVSYSRGMGLPYYRLLNPTVVWNSPNSCSYGNPYLEPEYSDGVQLYYSFLNDFVFNASYGYSSGKAEDFEWYDGDISTSTFINGSHSNSVGFGINYSRGFGRYVRFSASLGTDYKNIVAHDASESFRTENWVGSMDIRLFLFLSRRNQFYVNLFGRVRTPAKNLTAYFDDWNFHTSVQLQKGFGAWGSLTLDVTPWASRMNYHYDSDEYSYSKKQLTPYSYATLSFTCYFGKEKVRGAGMHNNNKIDNR